MSYLQTRTHLFRYVLVLHVVSGYTKTITGDESLQMLVLFNNVYTFQCFIFVKWVMNPSKRHCLKLDKRHPEHNTPYLIIALSVFYWVAPFKWIVEMTLMVISVRSACLSWFENWTPIKAGQHNLSHYLKSSSSCRTPVSNKLNRI